MRRDTYSTERGRANVTDSGKRQKARSSGLEKSVTEFERFFIDHPFVSIGIFIAISPLWAMDSLVSLVEKGGIIDRFLSGERRP